MPEINHATLIQLIDSNWDYFDDLWTSGEENERFMRYENWTDDEKKKIEAQGRQAYSIGVGTSKINKLLVEQRKSRTSFRVEATSDPEDEIKAELATYRLKDFETRSKFRYKESDIFDSGVGAKYGVGAFRIGKDKFGNDIIYYEDVDYRDFMWDKNAKTYEKNDSVFQCEFYKYYRYQLQQMFPKKEIKRAGEDTSLKYGRAKESFYVQFGENADLDILTLFTMYIKTYRKFYQVVFDGEIVGEFSKRSDAKKEIRRLNLPYINRGIETPRSSIIPDQKEYFDCYKFTYNETLDYEETEWTEYPYSIYQSLSFKNHVWCLMDAVKDPQMFFDRLIAQIDYQFGKAIKNAYELVTPNLEDGWDYNKALEALEDGKPIAVIAPNTLVGIPDKNVNVQFFQMANIMADVITEILGGKSFHGLTESKSESGRAIRLKQAEGQMVAAIFIDNLKRWKSDVGSKALYFHSLYDTAERTFKVHGASLTPEMMQVLQGQGLYAPSNVKPGIGYLTINKQSAPISYLDDFHYELVVTEAELSDTQREQKYAELMLYNEIFPGTLTPEVVLEFMSMEYSLKQKLIQNFNSQAQMMQALEQAVQQLELKDKQVDIMAKVEEILNEKRKTQIEAAKVMIEKRNNNGSNS